VPNKRGNRPTGRLGWSKNLYDGQGSNMEHITVTGSTKKVIPMAFECLGENFDAWLEPYRLSARRKKTHSPQSLWRSHDGEAMKGARS